MRERDIERHLVKRVKALGGEVRKVKWVGRDAAPDRLVMVASWGSFGTHIPFHCWVELKAPGGLATFPKNAHERKQAREHDRMRRMGQRVEIIDSIDGVERLLT